METIIFRNCIEKDNRLIFFSAREAIPVSLDLKSEETSIIKINNKELYRNNPFDLITELDGKIYALEIWGKYMCEYSLDSQEVAYIKIDCNKKKDGNFAFLTTEKNQVLIFDRADGLTIYDIVSKSICKVPYPQNEYEVITGCKYENKYYLFPKEGNKVFQYDVLAGKWDTIYLQGKWYNAMHAIVDNGSIYILMEDGTIIKWNVKEEVKFIDTIKEWYKSLSCVARICSTNDSFVILPSLGEDILILDKEKYEVKVMQGYPKDFKYVNNNWSKYYGYCETEDSYIFACRKSDYILKITKSNTNFEWIKSEIESEKMIQYRIMNNMIIQEKSGYLRYLLSGDFC